MTGPRKPATRATQRAGLVDAYLKTIKSEKRTTQAVRLIHATAIAVIFVLLAVAAVVAGVLIVMGHLPAGFALGGGALGSTVLGVGGYQIRKWRLASRNTVIGVADPTKSNESVAA